MRITNITQKVAIFLIAALTITPIIFIFTGDNTSSFDSLDAGSDQIRHLEPLSPYLQEGSPLSYKAKASNFTKAKIDTNARLKELFEQFPELATELHEPNPELVKRFKALFPRTSNSRNPFDFDSMILGTTTWDEKSASNFLKKNESSISEVISLIHAFDSLEAVQFEGLSDAIRLLSTSYALNLKLGNELQAHKIYNAAINLSNDLAGQNLIQTSFSIALTESLGRYNLKLFSESPELMHLLGSTPLIDYSMSKSMKSEFSSCLQLFYNFSEVNHEGVPYFNMNNDNIIKSLHPQKKYISLEKVEHILAHQFISLIKCLEQCQNSHKYITGEEAVKKFKHSLETQLNLSETEKQLADILLIGTEYYFDAIRDAQQITQIRHKALQIAYAQHIGNKWDGQLPTNYKNGKPIVWDKEKNVLYTGLEGHLSKVYIPTAK